MAGLRIFKPEGRHFVRRYPEWLDPPSCCDVCGGPVVLLDMRSRADWRAGRPKWSNAYHCLECAASVTVHPQSVYPKGLMADKETRALRARVHELLDPLWKSQRRSRSEAYALLGALLGMLPWETPHVGLMDADRCRRAIEALRPSAMAEDFG